MLMAFNVKRDFATSSYVHVMGCFVLFKPGALLLIFTNENKVPELQTAKKSCKTAFVLTVTVLTSNLFWLPQETLVSH